MTGRALAASLVTLTVAVTNARAGHFRKAEKRAALAIIEQGSLKISNTANADIPRFVAPGDAERVHASIAAARNRFMAAAEFIIDHADSLPINRDTAILINRMVAAGESDVVGDPNARKNTDAFYKWLSSPDAAALGRRDPVLLAQEVHDQISGLDAFPEGNGRTGRLMADLVMLKAGKAPFLHENQASYFASGSPLRTTSSERQRYFDRAAARGHEAFERLRREYATRRPSWKRSRRGQRRGRGEVRERAGRLAR